MAFCEDVDEFKENNNNSNKNNITNNSFLKKAYSADHTILILGVFCFHFALGTMNTTTNFDKPYIYIDTKGEQDFSLSLAIRKKYAPKMLIATAYFKEPPKQDYWVNIDQLGTLGTIVKFNINALDLESSLKCAGIYQKYDRIIFTFPRSEKIQSDQHNQEFIEKLCENAINCLNEANGELHLLLHFNEQHLESQYHHWAVDKIPNYKQINQLQFNLDTITTNLFPGYQPKTEKGKNWKPKLPVMCLMTPDFHAIHQKEIQQQIQSDYQIALKMSQNYSYQ